jgi:hypothetical protein
MVNISYLYIELKKSLYDFTIPRSEYTANKNEIVNTVNKETLLFDYKSLGDYMIDRILSEITDETKEENDIINRTGSKGYDYPKTNFKPDDVENLKGWYKQYQNKDAKIAALKELISDTGVVYNEIKFKGSLYVTNDKTVNAYTVFNSKDIVYNLDVTLSIKKIDQAQSGGRKNKTKRMRKSNSKKNNKKRKTKSTKKY